LSRVRWAEALPARLALINALSSASFAAMDLCPVIRKRSDFGYNQDQEF
jgi:hypothetical protein